MYHFLNKIQNLPEMNQEFSYIFYTFLKNLPEMEEKSPSFHFQTHHMYVFGKKTFVQKRGRMAGKEKTKRNN